MNDRIQTTNVETRSERVILSSGFGLPWSFVVWTRALTEHAKDCLFLRSDFFSNENKRRLVGVERLQIPASGNKIKKLRPISETHESFRAIHVWRQTVRETFEAVAGKNFPGAECERLELRLMLVFGWRDCFLTPNTKQ